MGFFETPPPPPEPEYSAASEESRLGAYVPGIVPVERELGRSDRAVMVLDELRVFPDGIEFALHTHLSPAATEEYEALLNEKMELLHERSALQGSQGYGRMVLKPVVTKDDKSAARQPRPRIRMPFGLFSFGPFGRDDDEPRFGVQLADGTKVTSLEPYVPADSDEEPLVGLERADGGGSAGNMAASVFLWPLPPPGPLVVAAEWAAQGIVEARLELDGEAIASAARRAHPIWEADTGLPSHRLIGLHFIRHMRAAQASVASDADQPAGES